MKLNCSAHITDVRERKSLLDNVKEWANLGYSEIGDIAYAGYCGADRQLADAIIALFESKRDHAIELHEGGDA